MSPETDQAPPEKALVRPTLAYSGTRPRPKPPRRIIFSIDGVTIEHPIATIGVRIDDYVTPHKIDLLEGELRLSRWFTLTRFERMSRGVRIKGTVRATTGFGLQTLARDLATIVTGKLDMAMTLHAFDTAQEVFDDLALA